jgi:putative hydrolase of the HAD superfamily
VIRLVIFDVNGVLYDYDKPARLAHLARLTGLPAAEIDRLIWQSGFEDAGDAGALDAGAYLAGFAQALSHPLSADDYTAALAAALRPIAPMLALAQRLAPRVRLATLTNNNFLVRDRMDQLYPGLRPIFGDHLCVSAAFGCRKPDPAVFCATLARLGAAPGEALFIDDSAANAEAAAAAGLAAHHHTGQPALEARLASLGI